LTLIAAFHPFGATVTFDEGALQTETKIREQIPKQPVMRRTTFKQFFHSGIYRTGELSFVNRRSTPSVSLGRTQYAGSFGEVLRFAFLVSVD
jgi:hypothetical protein